MSLLGRFNDGECRAWFAAVVALCALPDEEETRDYAARAADVPSIAAATHSPVSTPPSMKP